MAKRQHRRVSLINYTVNDDARIDESLMYVNMLNRFESIGDIGKDTYLKGNEFHNYTRPIIPLLIAKTFFFLTGKNMDLTILLLHSIVPFLCSVLVFFSLQTFFGLGPVASFFLVLVVAFEGLASVFSFLEKGRFLNHLIRHAIDTQSVKTGHLPYFTRFFSPGLTLFLFWGSLVCLWKSLASKDRGWAIAAGVTFALNLYAYPHQIYVLFFVFATAFWMKSLQKPADKNWRPNLLATLWSAWLFALPFLYAILDLKHFPAGRDMVARVGFSPAWYYRTYQTSTCLLCLALLYLHFKVTKTNFRKFLENQNNLCFASLLAGTFLSLLFLSPLEATGRFPQPWLVADRVTTYTIPIVLWFALTSLKGFEFSRERFNRLAAMPAIAFLLLVVCFVQLKSSRVHFPFFFISDEKEQFLEAVRNLPAGQIILTNDYSLNATLACETKQWNYVPYCINSNATTEECFKRLLVANVIAGLSFDQFYDEKYVWLPGSPGGEHWAFHHQADDLHFTKESVKALYTLVEKESPENLLSMYPIDYVYGDHVGKKFQRYFEGVGVNLFQHKPTPHTAISKRKNH